ncbi:hypothetical protein ADK57_27640 [Streptomyces sp. MMG1533]|uniref:hypothetical protein n=1 Tax=Streptomyces sp. MMG1533 TaxID=1415546 RepID=UPI0006ADA8CD|nr:hypothetical protein [Streptomyces sp. MMG1533]KOU61527.1 hypothetical protein ADK57_27640 [Streptomyces sp. MMG1533]
MAGRPVAVQGEVSATAGQKPFEGADSGKWTAGTVNETASDTLKVDGSFVLHQASCAFTFTGKAGQTPVSGSSTVELTPTTDKLFADGTGVLLDGDAAGDAYGNTLKASSAGRLHVS